MLDTNSSSTFHNQLIAISMLLIKTGNKLADILCYAPLRFYKNFAHKKIIGIRQKTCLVNCVNKLPDYSNMSSYS